MINNATIDWKNESLIINRLAKEPQLLEVEILSYLKHGNLIASSASIINDCIDATKTIETCLYTDNIWFWNDALIYYIENYHYRIDESFLLHMQKVDWKISVLTNEDILLLIENEIKNI